MEGVDISIPKGGKKGSSPQRDNNQNQDQSMLQADEQFGNRENQSMNIEVSGNYNQNVNMFYQEPKVNMPVSQNANPQMNQSEVYEKEMKVIDKVMDTLNSVVSQLDIMNTNMKTIESRIEKLEVNN